jgi:hypothetical protein
MSSAFELKFQNAFDQLQEVHERVARSEPGKKSRLEASILCADTFKGTEIGNIMDNIAAAMALIVLGEEIEEGLQELMDDPEVKAKIAMVTDATNKLLRETPGYEHLADPVES